MADPSEPADLYGLPLEEFTSQRDLLVRRLLEEDRGEEASQVARLRKPTIDAWALNQAVRRQPKTIDGLVGVHRKLRDAKDGDALRKASEERRRLIEEIVDAAVSSLEEAGRSASGPVRDRMSFTLMATAGDPEAEQVLARGMLERPVEIGEQWPASALPAPAERGVEDADRLEELEQLEAKAEELSAEAKRLRHVAEEAAAVLTEARSQAEQASGAARDAEKAAKEAERELKAARRKS